MLIREGELDLVNSEEACYEHMTIDKKMSALLEDESLDSFSVDRDGVVGEDNSNIVGKEEE